VKRDVKKEIQNKACGSQKQVTNNLSCTSFEILHLIVEISEQDVHCHYNTYVKGNKLTKN
jgi:hypothetical protein